jgi:hypothetical protein
LTKSPKPVTHTPQRFSGAGCRTGSTRQEIFLEEKFSPFRVIQRVSRALVSQNRFGSKQRGEDGPFSMKKAIDEAMKKMETPNNSSN